PPATTSIRPPAYTFARPGTVGPVMVRCAGCSMSRPYLTSPTQVVGTFRYYQSDLRTDTTLRRRILILFTKKSPPRFDSTSGERATDLSRGSKKSRLRTRGS